MKRLFVIQEHDAERAGLHWDLRFEAYGDTDTYLSKRDNTPEPLDKTSRVLKSFAVPKSRLPDFGEKLLAIPTEDHPWNYKDFEGTIPDGYGAGTVKLLFSDYIEISEMRETKIKFAYNKKTYVIFAMGNTGKWLIMRK